MDLRIGRAFGAEELVAQKYRALGFWANILTVGLVVLFFVSLVIPVVWLLFIVALLFRFIMAVGKLYYEEVYEIRK